MAAAATRKAPNAFMFCRQLDVLRKAGESDQSFDVLCLIVIMFAVFALFFCELEDLVVSAFPFRYLSWSMAGAATDLQ